MSSILRLTRESHALLTNILTQGTSEIIFHTIFFEKVYTVGDNLSFLPQVIESLIFDYLNEEFVCKLSVHSGSDIFVFNIPDQNIFFEVYLYDSNTHFGIHDCQPNYKLITAQKVVKYHNDRYIFLTETFNEYMKRYYNRTNYLSFKNTIHCSEVGKIEKVLNHKLLKLMIVMIKVVLRVFKKVVIRPSILNTTLNNEVD